MSALADLPSLLSASNPLRISLFPKKSGRQRNVLQPPNRVEASGKKFPQNFPASNGISIDDAGSALFPGLSGSRSSGVVLQVARHEMSASATIILFKFAAFAELRRSVAARRREE